MAKKIQFSENFKFSIFTDKTCVPTSEAMHEGVPTRNYTRYMAESLYRSVPYWTDPYLAPVILNHEQENGDIIGRVIYAEVKESEKLPGKKALCLTQSITDKRSAECVKDGRYSTVSIGVTFTDVRCSICGHMLAAGDFCEHERGEVYDGVTCYWDIYDMIPKELSYVIVPSDKYAQTIDVQEMDVNDFNTRKEESNMNQNEKDSFSKLSDDEKIKKIEEFEEKLATAINERESVKSEKIAAEKAYEDMKKAKEDADAELLKIKESAKEMLVDRVIATRKRLNMSAIEKEELKKRTSESLQDFLNDFESIEGKEQQTEDNKEDNKDSEGATNDIPKGDLKDGAESANDKYKNFNGSVKDPSLNTNLEGKEKEDTRFGLDVNEELKNMFSM